jgi:hypothetical protein
VITVMAASSFKSGGRSKLESPSQRMPFYGEKLHSNVSDAAIGEDRVCGLNTAQVLRDVRYLRMAYKQCELESRRSEMTRRQTRHEYSEHCL